MSVQIRGASSRLVRSAPLVAIALVFLAASLGLAVAPGGRLWVRRFDGTIMDQDYVAGVAVSPDSSAVFVTGSSSSDWVTAAYDASDGSDLWTEPFDGPAHNEDVAADIAMAPDGSALFVTGSSHDGSDTNQATVAYDPASGEELWAKVFAGSDTSEGGAAVAVSPDSSRVFVTGHTSSPAKGYDFLTIARDAASGERLWTKRYNGPGNDQDSAAAIAVSPNGNRVFVTGFSNPEEPGSQYDYRTISYGAGDGHIAWSRRYAGPSDGQDMPADIAVSADGRTVIVTGSSVDADTIAYRATSGAIRWKRAFLDANTWSIAVDPDGDAVFVTGEKYPAAPGSDYLTASINVRTGAANWTRRYSSGPNTGFEFNTVAAVAPDGSTVFVTGASWTGGSPATADIATVAYEADDGARQWARRYDGPVDDYDAAADIAVLPDGSAVIVSGSSAGEPDVVDYATIAYATG